MSLASLVEWNVSLDSADVSWGGVRAIWTAAKETTCTPSGIRHLCMNTNRPITILQTVSKILEKAVHMQL